MEIGGTGTQNIGLQDAVKLIRGPKNSLVILKIYRDSEKKIFDVSVARAKVSVPSLKATEITYSGKNFLNLELSIFADDTKMLLRQAFAQHDPRKFDGVLLDLRGNGGGYLPVAVDVASFFLKKGLPVVSSKYALFPDEIFTSFGYIPRSGIADS